MMSTKSNADGDLLAFAALSAESDTAIVDASALTTAAFSGGIKYGTLYNQVSGSSLSLAGAKTLRFTGNATGTTYGAGVSGGTGNDILTGLDGDDTFDGGTGNNVIDGGGGQNTAAFDFSDRTSDVVLVNGGAANVTYQATVGGVAAGSVRNIQALSITGGSGNDRIGGAFSRSGAQTTFTGGAGTDTAVVDASGLPSASFSGGVRQGILYDETTGATVRFSGIEGLEFTGNATAGRYGAGVSGGTGNDILTGLDGDDTFDGGTGNNVIDGGGGQNTAAFDFSDRTSDVVLVNGGAANVTYQATVGGVAAGSVRNIQALSITGGSGNDRIGGAFSRSGAQTTFTGGAGTDTAVVDASGLPSASFSGGVRQGILYDETTGAAVRFSGIEGLEFTGNATAGRYGAGVSGGTGNDILTGLDGDDTFDGGTGNNVIDGGGGQNTAAFDFSDRTGDVVLVGGNAANVTYQATVGGVAAGSARNIQAFSITGGSGNDRIGGAFSRSGAQTTFTGGAGTDTAVVDASGLPSASFSGGVRQGILYDETTGAAVRFSGIEGLEFTGNATAGRYGAGVSGGTGNDILTGLDGDDTFDGGTGNNVIDGGGGQNTAAFDFSDRTGDVVLVGGNAANVTYQATVGGVAAGSARNIQAFSITGGSGNDRIGGAFSRSGVQTTFTGGAGTDTAVVDASGLPSASFSGGVRQGILYDETTGAAVRFSGIEGLEFTGNATAGRYGAGVSGGTGNDILTGLDGDDTFDGDAGNDTIDGGGGNDRLTGGVGNDLLLGGDGDDTLLGGDGDDELIDFSGSNQVSGGDGDDLFFGVAKGSGTDTLTGGAGIDSFILSGDLAATVVPDIVTDFTPGNRGDIINLSVLTPQFRGLPPGMNPFAAGFVRLVQNGTDTLVQVGADGPAAPANFVTMLRLQGVQASAIGAGNFSSLPVVAPNLAPKAATDSVTANEDGPTYIPLAALLANDYAQVPGYTLSFDGLPSPTSSAGSTLSVAGSTITYMPSALFQSLGAGATAIDTFSYRIVDSGGSRTTGIVAVTVIGSNDAPIARPDTVAVSADAPTTTLASSLLANDTDPDGGDTLRIIGVDSSATAGLVRFDPGTQQIIYVPNTAAIDVLEPGTDSFTYTIADTAGATSTATASLNLQTTPIGFALTSAEAPAKLSQFGLSPIAYHLDTTGLAGLTGTVEFQAYLSRDGALDASDLLVAATTLTAVPSGSFDGQLQVPAAAFAGLPFGTYQIVVEATLQLDRSSHTLTGTATTSPIQFVPSYAATITSGTTDAAAGQSVTLHGITTSTSGTSAVPFAAVDVTFTHGAYQQTLSTTSDGSGAFSVSYASLQGAAGTYLVSAHNPRFQAEDATPEAAVRLAGLDIVQHDIEQAAPVGTENTGTLTLNNPGDTSLTGLDVSTTGLPAGWTFLIDDLPQTLAAGTSTSLHYKLAATTPSDHAAFTVQIGSAQRASDSIAFDVTAHVTTATLGVAVDALTRGVVRGGEKLITFTVANSGQEAAENVRIVLPGIPWLHLASAGQIGTIPGGASTVVTLRVDPANDVALGHYVGQVLIQGGTASSPVTLDAVPLDLNVTSTRKGGLSLTLNDEYAYLTDQGTHVRDATVRLFDAATGQQVGRYDGVNGVLNLDSLTEGSYRIQVSADKHTSYSQTIKIEAGAVREITAFIPLEGVKYSWAVDERTVGDHYHIRLDSTFETDVPVPLVTMDPPILDFADLGFGESKVIELTVTNHGFIRVENVGLDLPDPTGFVITPLVGSVGEIAAKSAVKVPVTIRRLPIVTEPSDLPGTPPGTGTGSDGAVSPGFPTGTNPTDCAIYGSTSGTVIYKYECGPDGVWRSVPIGYDGPDTSGAPCLPGSGGVWVAPGGGTIGGGGSGPGSSSGTGGGGTGVGGGSRPGAGYVYVGNPVETNGAIRCDAGSDVPDCLLPLGLKALAPIAIGVLLPFEIEGVVALAGLALVKAAAEELADAAIDHYFPPPSEPGGGSPSPDPGYAEAGLKLAGAAAKDFAEEYEKHLPEVDLGSVLGSAALRGLNRIVSTADLTGDLLDLLECLSSHPSEAMAMPGKVSARALQADMAADEVATTDPAATSNDDSLAAVEAQLLPMLGPRFAGLTKIDDIATRLVDRFNLRAYLFGGLEWFDTSDKAGLIAYTRFVANAFEAGVPISAASIIAPAGTRDGLPAEFVERFNRSLAYWSSGIFRVSDVPTGLSTDFIALDTLQALQERITGPAHETNETLAQIYLADVAAAQSVEAAYTELLIEQQKQIEGVCATVKLRIEQDVVMSRSAFVGSLVIDADREALDGIELTVTVTDDEGNAVDPAIFGISNSYLSGVSALDGTHGIPIGGEVKAEYTFVPSIAAAATGPTRYHIAGTLTVHEPGNTYTTQFSPVAITVLPQPVLELDYFQERNVVGDDPFTDDVIEASVPFLLGVQVHNTGKGAATDLEIDSAQPKIIDNKKGLAVDFAIVSSEVAGVASGDSLTATFGNLAPGSTKTGAWFLESTLQGKFIEYQASYTHLDPLGLKDDSLIKSVRIHELIHGGDVDSDGQLDFLTNDVADLLDAPETLYRSNGTQAAVATLAATSSIIATGVGTITERVTVASSASGWAYLDVAGPAPTGYHINSVARADGSLLGAGAYWYTDRTFTNAAVRPVYENRVHLLDGTPSSSYVVQFTADQPPGPPPTVDVTSSASTLKAGQLATITFTFSADPGSTFTWDGSSGDLMVTGGTLSAIAGSGLVRTATFMPTAGVDNGTASIAIAAGSYTDSVGSYGTAATLSGLSFDTSAPSAPSGPILAVTSDSGANDGITNVVTPTFTGTAEPGSTITLFDTDGTMALGHGEATDGTWSITASLLAEGLHKITAQATDQAGNKGQTSSSLTVQIDTTAPLLSTPGPITAEATSAAGATVSFAGSAADAVSGAAPVVFSKVAGSVFALGTTTVTESAMDLAGNVVSSTFTVMVVDTTAPTLTTPGPITVEATSAAGAVVSFTGSAADAVSGSVPVRFSKAPGSPFALGSTTVTESATDAAGNTATSSFTVKVVDTTPPDRPAITGVSPDGGLLPSDGVVTTGALVLSGTAEPLSTVTLFDGAAALGSAAANGTGAWTLTLASPLAQGTHSLSAKAMDASGNTSLASTPFAVTVQPPPTLVTAVLPITVAEGMRTDLLPLLLANARDLDQAHLTVTAAASSGLAGSLQFNQAARTLIYQSAASNGTTAAGTLAYTVTDSQGSTVSGTATISVTGAVQPMVTSSTVNASVVAPGSGTRVVSNAGGQTLLGNAAGNVSFFGGADTRVTALGSGNLVSVQPGNHTIAAGANNNRVVLGNGNNTVTGTGTGNTVTGGTGNTTISGMGGNSTITLGDGKQVITLTGANNTVMVGTGNSTLNVGSGGNERVTVAGGNNTISAGGAGDAVTVGDGNNVITLTGVGATVALGNGANTVTISGSGSKVTAGNGGNTIQLYAGGNMIRAGLGNDVIRFAGTGSVIDGGGGNDALFDTGSGNTIVLGAAAGTTTLSGNVLTNGDLFDLRVAMASTAWNGGADTLGSYLQLGMSGNNATVLITPAVGSATMIAMLVNSGPVSLSTFSSHSLLS